MRPLRAPAESRVEIREKIGHTSVSIVPMLSRGRQNESLDAAVEVFDQPGRRGSGLIKW